MRKSKRPHSSSALFWIGVPLSTSRCSALGVARGRGGAGREARWARGVAVWGSRRGSCGQPPAVKTPRNTPNSPTPLFAPQLLGDLRKARLAAADDVALVEDHVVPRHARRPVRLGSQRLVGHDSDAVAAGQQLPGGRRALRGRAGDLEGSEDAGRHVLAHLVRPVADERRGADDEGGQPRGRRRAGRRGGGRGGALGGARGHDGRRLARGGRGGGRGGSDEGFPGGAARTKRLAGPEAGAPTRRAAARPNLQRLAQPHVVRQDAVQPEAPQEREPADAVTLVGARRHLGGGGRGI
jgi:hypothetical protein